MSDYRPEPDWVGYVLLALLTALLAVLLWAAVTMDECPPRRHASPQRCHAPPDPKDNGCECRDCKDPHCPTGRTRPCVCPRRP